MKYSLASDCFDDADVQAVIDVMRSKKYTMGEKVREFENAIAAWTGFKHSVMVNSGSSANLLLIDSLLRRTKEGAAQLKVGDEVIVPALSWPTTVWPLVQLGLKPVFVDIDPKTLAIDLESAKASLGPKTRGMFLIHVLGLACDMKAYTKFCADNNLVLIEDCCESFGAYDEGKHVGTFGYGGTASHFFSHQLTTIEGGTIFSNDAELVDDLRSLRAHGWIRDRSDKEAITKKYPEFDARFLFLTTGYNVRPMELQAAIGLNQLKKIDGFLDQRQKYAGQVNSWLKDYCPWLNLIGSEHLAKPATSRTTRKHSWMNLPFKIDPGAGASLAEVMNVLEESGVECRPIIAGNLVRHPATQTIEHRVASNFDQADSILNNGFMIGCHPMTSDESMETLEKALQNLRRFA